MDTNNQEWIAHSNPIKQSNFGVYKTLVRTPQGNIRITADDKETAKDAAIKLAAALDMLAALEAIENHINDGCKGANAACRDIRKNAQAAIAKARGGNNG